MSRYPTCHHLPLLITLLVPTNHCTPLLYFTVHIPSLWSMRSFFCQFSTVTLECLASHKAWSPQLESQKAIGRIPTPSSTQDLKKRRIRYFLGHGSLELLGIENFLQKSNKVSNSQASRGEQLLRSQVRGDTSLCPLDCTAISSLILRPAFPQT